MPRRSTVLDHPDREAIDAEIGAGLRSVKGIALSYGLPYRLAARYARRLRDDPARLEAGTTPAPMDAVRTFVSAFDLEPTEYQVAYLTDARSTVVLKSRQCGMTTAAAALAIWTARSAPGRDAVVVSPSLPQSKELTTRARAGLYHLGEPLVQDSTSLLRLRNGSRIVSLPGNQRAVRGYSPALVIADEASWIADETFQAIRPLLAASHGRLVCQSTPGAEVGWFHALWQSELGEDWLRLEVPATAVPFIDAEFLETARREMSPVVFAAEFGCTFGSEAPAAISTPLFWDGGDSMFTPDEAGDDTHAA